jgi:hypothetical protein
MKEFFEKLSLAEFIAFLCPGAILLSSFLFWVPIGEIPLLNASKDTWQSLTASLFLLIMAYALGMIVATASSAGAKFYLLRMRRRRYGPPPKPPLPWTGWTRWFSFVRPYHVGRFFSLLSVEGLGFVFGLPEPRVDDIRLNDQKGRMELALLQRGAESQTTVETPWDFLTLYRTVVAGVLGPKRGQSLSSEADSVHRRLLISLGLALVALLIAAQSLLRLVLHLGGWSAGLPTIGHWGLLAALTAVGCLLSWLLRIHAGRCWETEYVLTCGILWLVENPAAEKAEEFDPDDAY